MTRQRFLPVATVATGPELDRLTDSSANVNDLHIHDDFNWINFPPALDAQGWVNDTGNEPPQWRIDSSGFMHFRGRINGDSATGNILTQIVEMPLHGILDQTKNPLGVLRTSYCSTVGVSFGLQWSILNLSDLGGFTGGPQDSIFLESMQSYQVPTPCQTMIYMIGDNYVSQQVITLGVSGDCAGYTDPGIALTPNAYNSVTDGGRDLGGVTAQFVLDNIVQVQTDIGNMIGPVIQVHMAVGNWDRANGLSAADTAVLMDQIVTALQAIPGKDVTVIHTSYNFTTFIDDFAALMTSATTYPNNYVYVDLHYADPLGLPEGDFGLPTQQGSIERVQECYGIGPYGGAKVSLPDRDPTQWPQTFANSAP